jgi:hypothetical protein
MTKNVYPDRSSYIKPSIQAALDEAHPTGPGHHPSVRSSLERPDDVFDPNDPDQQGLPLAGFKVEPGSAPTTAPETSLLDAMRYGTGFTHISSGNEGVEVTNIPFSEAHVVENDRLPIMNTTHMDFGHAIRCMEAGNRVQRDGWNGKNMWIAISGLEGPRSVIATNFWSKHASDYAREIGGAALVLPCIIMKTATGEILMGWLASQSDMLAKDWRIVP